MERVENKRKVYNFRKLIVNIAGDIIKIVLGIILFILSIASIDILASYVIRTLYGNLLFTIKIIFLSM